LEVNIIEHKEEINSLFSKLRLESKACILRNGPVEIKGMVSAINLQTIEIFLSSELPTFIKKVNLDFSFGIESFFCSCKVVSRNKKNVILEKPNQIQNRSLRKHPRIWLTENDAVFARFNILTNNTRNVTETVSAPPKLATIYFELQKNVPDVKRILGMVGEEIKKISTSNEVVLHKKNMKVGIETKQLIDAVKLVLKTKKSFLIEEIVDLRDMLKKSKNDEILNLFSLYLDKESSGMNSEDSKKYIVEKFQVMKNLKISSFGIVPIMLFNNVIGHIVASTTEESMKSLKMTDLYYLKALADVISESLAKARLFKIDTGGEFDLPVLNISLGGAYLVINSQHIVKYLHEGILINVCMKFKNYVIETQAEVRRISYNKDSVGIGIKFTKMKNEPSEILKKFIGNRIGYDKAKEIMEGK